MTLASLTKPWAATSYGFLDVSAGSTDADGRFEARVVATTPGLGDATAILGDGIELGPVSYGFVAVPETGVEGEPYLTRRGR